MKNTQIKKKGSVKKWIIVGAIILLAFAGYKFISTNNQTGQKREALETQQQVMIEHWQEQGLSEEEIQEELESFRLEQRGDRSEPSALKKILGGKRGGR